MPDLDPIKQAEQGCGLFSKARPAISSGATKTSTQAADFAADLLQKQHTDRWCFSERLYPARLLRAREFFDVVTGLWDSWAEDAFIRDVENGIYFDPERMHVLDHKGEFLSVRGPLNIARPIQGWPVIVQAGASDAGRQLAAETAEVIFASGGKLADAQRYYADVRQRAKKVGRDPDHIKILPGALVVVGETAADAREKRALLDSLVHPDSGIASLSIALGHDASGFDLDAPLPEIPESNASKSGRERAIELARREHMTVR